VPGFLLYCWLLRRRRAASRASGRRRRRWLLPLCQRY